MASLRTPTTNDGGQGTITILNVAACVTGDTVSFKESVRGFWVNNNTTTDACTVSYSTTTNLFTVTVANTPGISIFVLR